MEIQILHVPDCPNLALARARLEKALEHCGTAPSLQEMAVNTADEAGRVGMRGSPTILVDGRDPFDTSDGTSLSCRLYATPAGIDGAPSVDQLVAVLSS